MELHSYTYKGKDWISVLQLGGLMDIAPSHIYHSLKHHKLALPKMRFEDDSQKRMYVTTAFAEQLLKDFNEKAQKVGLKELRKLEGFSDFMKEEGDKYKKKSDGETSQDESLTLLELKAKIDRLSALLDSKLAGQ